jgi:uncharacterized protein
MISRRRFITSLSLLTTAGVSSGAYAHSYEPTHFDYNLKIVDIANYTGSEINILHLSDLHHSTDFPLESIHAAFQLIESAQPDLICITGDFITREIIHAEEYTQVLKRLSQKAPIFACLGNHDGGSWAKTHHGISDSAPVISILETAGIKVLHNESITIELKNQTVRITGLGDLWAGECKPELAFANTALQSTFHIVLSHNPDTKKFVKNYSWHLLLSGHTHGGQILLPILNLPLYLPIRDQRYYSGLYDWENRKIHISRGVGNLMGIRFNCRPEMTMLKVHGAVGVRIGSAGVPVGPRVSPPAN